ncbi:MAG: hypothetical protein RBU25_05695 [Lentisphaeria bacterium]|jgi:hypothetical protein|nr:hypothetical protein [Lentisphaeria bacterium]
MTIRALILGFAASMFIAGAGYINDRVLNLESFNNGHQVPIIVLGLMFVWVTVCNPLLHRLRRSWAFRPAEIALVVALTMASCGISGRGLMEQFAQMLVLPHHWNRITPGWQSRGMLDYAPKQALVDPEPENDVVTAFIQGKDPTEHEGNNVWERLQTRVRRVPWRQWSTPLATWLPMVFLVTVASVALGLVVHRQWASHEHLQYPIAQFTNALIERESDRAIGPIFRNHLFWVGFIIFFLIRLNNGLCVWFPDYLIPVKLDYSLWPFAAKWPALNRASWNWGLFTLRIFPLVIAFAFFLNAEISFTLGMSQILWAAFAIPVVGAGYVLTTDYDIGGWEGWNRAGSYTAFSLMLLYTGRQYYGELARKAVCVWRRVGGDRQEVAVWAFRALLVSLVALVALVIRLGLSWPLAIATVFLMMMTFLIVSRISAETGLFFIQPGWQPFGALMALMGGYAMGPEGIVISALVCGALCIDQSQALLPYLVNGLKICEGAKITPGRTAGATFAMYVVGVALAVFVVIVASYHFGTPSGYQWSYQRIPTMAFRAAEPEVMRLQALDKLDESQQLAPLERLAHIQPKPGFLWAAGMGFVGVLVFAFLRLRIPRWPFHPCLFLIWATYPLAVMSQSFLIGWIIKRFAVKYGGAKVVNRLKPLAIGVIAAEIFGALVFMVVGAIYFWVQEKNPLSYRYFPR